jgi:hypothetical protein
LKPRLRVQKFTAPTISDLKFPTSILHHPSSIVPHLSFFFTLLSSVYGAVNF